MSYYFDNISIQAKFDGINWVDFSDDTVGNITGGYGIEGNGAPDRIASPGELTFTMNNSESNSAGKVGYYSPGHVNCRPGFAPGLEVRIVFTLDLIPIQKYIGKIPSDGINVTPGMYKERTTSVTVRDWMWQAVIHPISGFPIATNKNIMEAIALYLENIPIQPPGVVDYRTGESIFSYVGDTLTSRTTAMAEFGKMIQSELGYLYLTRNGLRVEGRLTRNEEKTVLDEYPQSRAELGMLINEDGDFLVDETGSRILCSDSTSAIFENAQTGMVSSFGNNFYNSIKFTMYPRRVDPVATTVLFNLQSPMAIGAGETVILSGSYKDPSGVAQYVSGLDLVTPVANTHYKCYANKDGTGADLTANLTLTSVLGAGDFKYTFTNNGAAGYITLAKVVGRGVYTDIPAEYYLEDAASILEYGDYPLTIEMRYQDDPSQAARWAQTFLFQHKNLVSSVDSVSFTANASGPLLNAFLYLEPGDRIRFKEDVTAIHGDFFIHAVHFTIKPGNIVDFSWVLRSAGLDTFNFVKWTQDTTPVTGYGTWDDYVYGWDF